MELVKEYEQEPERENNWVEYYDGGEQVKVVGLELEEELKEKYLDSSMKLRVYIDLDNDRYFIDIFAAYSLGFISYKRACDDSDYGKDLFEISAATYAMLERVFEDKIERKYLPSKESERNYAFDVVDIENAKISDLVDNVKDNKNEELDKLFDKQYNDLSEFESEYNGGNIKNM